MSDGRGAVRRPRKSVAPQQVQRLDLIPNWYCGRPRAPAGFRRLLHEIELEAVLREPDEPVAPRVAVVAAEAQRRWAAYGHAVVPEGLRAVRVPEEHELDVVLAQQVEELDGRGSVHEQHGLAPIRLGGQVLDQPAVLAGDIGLGEVAVLFGEGHEVPSAPIEAVVDRPQDTLVVLDAADAFDVLVLVAVPALRFQLNMAVVAAVDGADWCCDRRDRVAEVLKLRRRANIGEVARRENEVGGRLPLQLPEVARQARAGLGPQPGPLRSVVWLGAHVGIGDLRQREFFVLTLRC